MPLDPLIIEEIRKREKEKRDRERAPQPTIDLPKPTQDPRPPAPKKDGGDSDRGVTVIDIMGDDD